MLLMSRWGWFAHWVCIQIFMHFIVTKAIIKMWHLTVQKLLNSTKLRLEANKLLSPDARRLCFGAFTCTDTGQDFFSALQTTPSHKLPRKFWIKNVGVNKLCQHWKYLYVNLGHVLRYNRKKTCKYLLYLKSCIYSEGFISTWIRISNKHKEIWILHQSFLWHSGFLGSCCS